MTPFTRIISAIFFAIFISATSVSAAISVQSSSFDLLLRRGYLLVQKGSYKPAVVVLRNAILLDPNDVNARRYMVFALIRLGDFDSAGKQISVISKMCKPTAVDYYLCGVLDLEGGNNDRALQQFRAALSLEPDMAAARAGIVELFIVASDFQGATFLCSDCVSHSHNDGERAYFQQLAVTIKTAESNALALTQMPVKTELPFLAPVVRSLIPLVIKAPPRVEPKIAPIATKASA